MEPLIWLAVPFVVTGAAGVVLHRRQAARRSADRRGPIRADRVRDEQLRRMAVALRPDPADD